MSLRRTCATLIMGTLLCLAVTLGSLAVPTEGAAFVHTATTSNTTASSTDIDDASCNGNPSARVLATQNLTPGGTAASVNDHPVGVWYHDGRWSIYNQDGADMALGAAFNVQVLPETSAKALVHTASVENIVSNWTNIANQTTDGNPSAIVLATPYSPGSERTGSTHHVGVWYEDPNWAIYNEDTQSMRAGAAFMVELLAAAGDSAFVHAATPENTPADAGTTLGRTWIDNPITNGNPDLILLVTRNWSQGGHTYADGAIAVLYDSRKGRWAIVNQSGPMPVGAAFNVLVVGSTSGQAASQSLSPTYIGEVDTHTDSACEVAVSPDGSCLLVGTSDQQTVSLVYRTSSTLSMARDYVLPAGMTSQSLAVASEGRSVVIGMQQGGVFVFSRSGDVLWFSVDPAGEVAVAVTDDGQRIFAAAYHTLICFDGSGNRLWSTTPDTRGWPIWQVSCAQDGTRILLRTNSDILILDAAGNEAYFHDVASGNSLVSASLSADGERFAVAVRPEQGSDYVALFDVRRGELWRQAVPDCEAVSMDASVDVFAVSQDVTYVWNSAGVAVGGWADGGIRVACSRDGMTWVVGRYGTARVYGVTQ